MEIAHEALLRRWSRLGEWVAEAREDLLLHQRLADSVVEWERHDRAESYLLAGGRLAQFEKTDGPVDQALVAAFEEMLS